jgi:SAM-dependent methyltransferase
MPLDTAADMDARARLRDMITGCWRTGAIFQAVQAGLLDALADGPKTAAEIAGPRGLHTESVGRLLRALSTLEVCRQLEPDRFALGPLGEPLAARGEGSMRGLANHWGGRLWGYFETLGHSLKTGEGAMSSSPDDFVAMQADPKESAMFNRAMAEQSLPVARALAGAYDFSGFRRVMDVGGGYGAVLATLLQANPGLRGEVFDLAALKDGALAYLAEAGVGDRAGFIGGDFFAAVPAGADCLVLKYIVHDWDDGNSVRLLTSCRKALAPGGAVVLIEQIVPPTVGPESEAVTRTDLVMMAVGGKERTEAEYRALLAAAGLELTRIVPIGLGFSALEARAA